MKAALGFFFVFEEDDLGIGLRLTPSHRGINANLASIFQPQPAFSLVGNLFGPAVSNAGGSGRGFLGTETALLTQP